MGPTDSANITCPRCGHGIDYHRPEEDADIDVCWAVAVPATDGDPEDLCPCSLRPSEIAGGLLDHAREGTLALVAEVERLRKFAQRTQERDWARLDGALRNAINGTWSMECDWSVYCIIEAHTVTGTWTPDTAILYGPLLLDGIYEAITGIPVSEETLAGCRDYFAPYPERHVFAGSTAEVKKAAEEARCELDEAARGER